MAYSKTVTIFLADGTPTGLRHAEIMHWTGQAIAFPRTRLPEVKDWSEEVDRSGVYFLLSRGEGGDPGQVYIGESEEMLKRLTHHARATDFWTDAVVFTNKDDNLNKGHIKYLERRLIESARDVGRFQIQNKETPKTGFLPRNQESAMEQFIDNLRIVLGTLGYRFLEPISAHATVGPQYRKPHNPIVGTELNFRFSGLTAYGTQSDEGFIVFAGSATRKDEANTFQERLKALKRELIQAGVLESRQADYRFARDYVFSSSSAAASLVSGSSRSGPGSWNDENGKTLKQLEEEMLEGFDQDGELASQE